VHVTQIFALPCSGARFYYGDVHTEHPIEPTTASTGLAAFAGDSRGIRRFASRDHNNIVHRPTVDHRGRFAAHLALSHSSATSE
jgi:hypothetical protein